MLDNIQFEYHMCPSVDGGKTKFVWCVCVCVCVCDVPVHALC